MSPVSLPQQGLSTAECWYTEEFGHPALPWAKLELSKEKAKRGTGMQLRQKLGR